MPPRVMLKHPNPCHDTDTHTSLDPAKSEVDLRASHDLSLRLFRGARALHSAVRGRAVRMGHEQDENSTLSSPFMKILGILKKSNSEVEWACSMS